MTSAGGRGGPPPKLKTLPGRSAPGAAGRAAAGEGPASRSGGLAAGPLDGGGLATTRAAANRGAGRSEQPTAATPHPPQQPPQQQHQQPSGTAGVAAAWNEKVALLDAKWGFHSAGASKLLSETSSDFRVMAVVAPHGPEKTALMSALLQDGTIGMTAPTVASTDPVGVSGRSATVPLAPGATKRGAMSHQQSASGCSPDAPRLDLRVHPGDRTLLLECPALWSTGWIAELAACSEPPLVHAMGPPGGGGGVGASAGHTLTARAVASARSCGLPALSCELVAEVLALQLGALMLAACHVVVLLLDSAEEPRMWEYLQVIDMIAHTLPDVAAAAASSATGQAGTSPSSPPTLPWGGPRRVAEVVVVLTGVDGDALTVRHLRPQYDLLRTALSSTRLLAGPGIAEPPINILRYLGEAPGNVGRPPNSINGETAPADRGGVAVGARSAGAFNSAPGTAAPAAASAAGETGVLHFWALPQQHWQHVGGMGFRDAGDLPHDLAPALLPPLRTALLSLPRRPLALTAAPPHNRAGSAPPGALPPQSGQPPDGRQPQLASHMGAVGAQATGTLLGQSQAALLLPQSQPAAVPVTEREWLRGLERLWGYELQHSAALERYTLNRQRTVFGGGGGWPLVGR